MSSLLNQLNLRPQERRLLVVVGAVLFVVLNIWLVWPHFDDWKQIQSQRFKAEQTLAIYKREIARIPAYEAQLKELESAGSNVIPEEQDLNLSLAVLRHSNASGLTVNQSAPRSVNSGRTNQFFEEQAVEIQVSTGNKELVDFLVNLASTESLIRVQNLNLQPEAGGTRLKGTIQLIASYQKKTAPGAQSGTPLKSTGTKSSATAAVAAKTPPESAALPRP